MQEIEDVQEIEDAQQSEVDPPAAVESGDAIDPSETEPISVELSDSGPVAAGAAPIDVPVVVETTTAGTETVDPETVDDGHPPVAMLYGSWTTDYHGDWVVTLAEGGGGEVAVVWDWTASLLYGSQIDFDLQWTYENGVLTQTLASGTPQANYDALMRDYGDTRTYEVLDITDDTLTVKSKKDDEITKWKRK